MRRWIALLIVALAVWAGFHWQGSPPPDEEAAPTASILQRGNGPEPESLDPHLARTDSAHTIVRDLFEGLTVLDAAASVQPGAADRWDVSEDGTSWTFHLREDGRWSDGSAVTAQDFLFAFRRLVDPATASPYATFLDSVVNVRAAASGALPVSAIGVTAVGERTVVIDLDAPTPHLTELLAHPSAAPVHRASVEAHGERYARPGNLVSNGPFALTGWVVGSHVEIHRNPHFREPPALDGVRFVHIVDESSELARFRAGELDMTYTIPISRYPWVRENFPDALRVAPYLGVYFYGFNTTRPPLDDHRVRRALSLVVDRELITSKITGIGEIPACGLVPPGTAGYAPASMGYCDLPMADRIERARELLSRAGFGPDRPLRLELRYNTGEFHQRLAVAIAGMWKDALGVEVELLNEEFRVLIANIRAKEVTQVYRASWVGDYNDAATFLGVLASDSQINGTGFSDAAYDRLLARAAREPDPQARQRLLHDAEALALESDVLLPLYFYVSKRLVADRVRGYEDNVMNVHASRYLSVGEG